MSSFVSPISLRCLDRQSKSEDLGMTEAVPDSGEYALVAPRDVEVLSDAELKF